MAETDPRPVLLTGASGALGRELARRLAEAGWTLRLTDIAPFPDALPPRATFTRADLADGVAVLKLAEGCRAIVHLGGISVERPFEEIVGPNLRGLYHIYEAARREGARVLFASSNHAVGFHERARPIAADAQLLPDGFYGLSKAFGEMMGRLYWFKHGVENVNIRIGSSFPEPVNARMLATWLSYADLTRMVVRAVEAKATGSCVIWGASANAAMTWWKDDARALIGWAPEDSSDGFAAKVGGIVSDDPIEERYMGGGFCALGYSREAPVQGELFG